MTGMAAEWLTVRTGDGRELEVLRYGPPEGRPLVYHSGTPSGAVEFPAQLQQSGVATLAAYERWAASQGALTLRTALVAHHASGLAFLERAGYRRLSTIGDYDAGARRATVIFLEKSLG